MTRFTDQYIKQLKAKADRYDVTETGVPVHQRGLQMRVFPSGAKTWLFRYTKDGKTERVKLGTYPTMNLRGAHKARDVCREQLDKDTTPKEAREEEAERKAEAQRERERTTARTVTALADDFINGKCRQMQLAEDGKTWVPRKKPGPIRKSWPEVKRIIDKDIIPAIGGRPVTDIKPHELADLLGRIRDRGAPIGANRTDAIVRQLFSHAVGKGWLKAADNPSRDLDKPTEVEPARERTLDDDQIRQLWVALDGARMLPIMRHVYRLILCTGCRPGEVTRAQWSEFDLDNALWTIPGERTKNGRVHEVHLTPLALSVLAELRADHDERQEKRPDDPPSSWLFPAHHHGKDAPIEDKAAAHAIRNNRDYFKLDAFTAHDLRRSVRTGLARLRVDSITAKKIMNHRLEGMDRVYDQHPYTEEKREALEKWCKHLEGVLRGDKPRVTDIKKARQRRAA